MADCVMGASKSVLISPSCKRWIQIKNPAWCGAPFVRVLSIARVKFLLLHDFDAFCVAIAVINTKYIEAGCESVEAKLGLNGAGL
jgi:hypothetical protein